MADDGVGFDPAAVGPHRFGLALSVHDRMARRRRAARRSSRRRGGARSCGCGGRRERPAERADDGPTPSGPTWRWRCCAGLRIGPVGDRRWSSCSAWCCPTSSPTGALPAGVDRTGLVRWACSRSPSADAVLVARRRTWGARGGPRPRRCSACRCGRPRCCPPSALVGPAAPDARRRSAGSACCCSPTAASAALLGFLAAARRAHRRCSSGSAGRLDLLTLVDLAVVVAATGGFQLAVGAAGAALDRVAGAATEAARRQAATVTAEEVARQLHDDREERYAPVAGQRPAAAARDAATAACRPRTPEVQRRAAVEAARLRRLFAEEGDVARPAGGRARARSSTWSSSAGRRGAVLGDGAASRAAARGVPRRWSTRSRRRCWRPAAPRA